MRETVGQHPLSGKREPNQTGKMLVPLLGVVAALSVIIATAAIALQVQERGKRLAKERALRTVVAENGELKGQLETAQRAKTRLEDDLGRSRKELAQTQEQLAKATEEQRTLTATLGSREEQLSRVVQELEQARAAAEQSAAQLAAIRGEHETLQQQVSTLQQSKQELESKMTQLSSRPTVELEKVLVTDTRLSSPPPAVSASPLADAFPASEPPAMPPARMSAAPISAPAAQAPSTSGQVVVVNREYDFIVMNLGKNHGLSIGQEFQIVRGDSVLGKVKVEKVYDELSAAAILPESQKDNIKEGDTVKAL